MDLFGRDLFGDEIKQKSRGPVADRFLFPPFSVIDAKQGDWQERKRAWAAMGIKGELGRSAKSYNIHEWIEDNRDEMNIAGSVHGDGTSIFDPVLCELAYRWFCPKGGQVVDPFAGGSVRGIVAAAMGRRYWGCDLRVEQVEANRAQADEILDGAAFCADSITPVMRVGENWIKRDDLCVIHGARGGKARTCWHLAKDATAGLTTAGSRESPQVLLVATMAKALGLPCVAHVPEGDITTGPVADAVKLGATVIQHEAGYNTVIAAMANTYGMEHGYTVIPFGMQCEGAVGQTRKQAVNIPNDVCRVVIPVGSGMSLSGLLWGMLDAGNVKPVIGVVVGADPSKRLDTYAPANWRDMVTLVPSCVDYSKHVDLTIGGVKLDPVYEAKCGTVLTAGDLLWIVGHRDAYSGDQFAPQWVCGDSTEMLSHAPDADFVFSCPPYGDLEKYSDDPNDLSCMEYNAFKEAYGRIILRAVQRLKQDRFACFVVGDFRDKRGFYRDFVSATIEAFRNAGAELYNEAILCTSVGSACMRVTKQFNSGRKFAKTHQNVLVFCKGDWRKAAGVCNG